jgi:hypothetical protein
MKTTLRNFVMTIGLAATLGSATLFAQTESKANIPFDFQITGQTLPAGQYLVKLNQENRMLVFRNIETGHSIMVLAHAYKSGTVEDPKLTFRHSGERYTLESAWFAGVAGGYGPPRGKSDRSESERGIVATVRLLQK